MKKYILYIIVLLVLNGCDRVFDVNYPVTDGSNFLSQTNPITDISKMVMEGVYSVSAGKENFGDHVVLKWSGDKLSIFTGRDAGYLVFKGGSLDSVLFFYGYWRYAVNSDVGLVNFYISSFEGGNKILSGDTTNLKIVIRGSYGDGDNLPGNGFTLEYLRPFSDKVKLNDFYILAHRGGGRNSDYLPHSENSIEMITIAEELGANGIELDVQLTKDGYPILYHDADLNLRLTQKSVIWGDVEDFTYAQLSTFVRLRNGEVIPLLEQALQYVLDNTKLRFVWLDLKSHRNEIPKVIEIQQKILKQINPNKRDLKIVLGVPTIEKAEQLKAYPKYEDIPSLCELEPDIARALNSGIWAPRWTQGTQVDLVKQMHAENRKCFTWTLDEVSFIEQFFREGEFDGFLTNYPMLVAYHHYMRE